MNLYIFSVLLEHQNRVWPCLRSFRSRSVCPWAFLGFAKMAAEWPHVDFTTHFLALPTFPFWMCFKCCSTLSLCFLLSSWLMTQGLGLRKTAATSRHQPSVSASHSSFLSVSEWHCHMPQPRINTSPLYTDRHATAKTNRDDQSYDSAVPHPARSPAKDTDVTAQKQTRCTQRVNVTLRSA